MAEHLTKARCILLAVYYASDSKLDALHKLCQLHSADFLPPELVLRILLTFLPGVTPPTQYTTLVSNLVSGHFGVAQSDYSLETTSVTDLSEATADKRLRKLSLLPLSPESYPTGAPTDILSRFICHRAYRIDEETCLTYIIPDLVSPFLEQSEYLRLWYISVVLPLLRLRTEYYPALDLAAELSLEEFDKIDGKSGAALLLSGADKTIHEITSPVESTGTITRDLRGLVGPWLYGHNAIDQWQQNGIKGEKEQGAVRGANGDKFADHTTHSWEPVFDWLLRRAVHDFPLVTSAIEYWDGPKDVDLTDRVDKTELMTESEVQALQRRYAQLGFAACFAVQANSSDAVNGAHGVLTRLADLLDFEPPPDLATSVDQLPRVDDHISKIETESSYLLDLDHLMDDNHTLTSPSLPAFMFLQMLVYSAYQLSGLGHNISILNVAKMRMFSSADDQMALLKRLLHGLTQNGKRDEHDWMADRGRIMWLWDWNIHGDGSTENGDGALGRIRREDLDKEIVTALLVTGNYGLIDRLYLRREDERHQLSQEDMEEVILAEAFKAYDNASNGNRNRGNMKKANDIVSAFRLSFPTSKSFERALALISATHSMSFYSLTLQHGVPFQPVNIRVAQDPLSLLEHILDQNMKSYTHLDDLISIGRSLAIASPDKVQAAIQHTGNEPLDQAALMKYAERRVIFMCISAALTSQDFDTAYSYLINRLSPSSSVNLSDPKSTTSPKEEDDISWRAAFLAGRYRPSSSISIPLSESIRRLEQRTELLSLALLLAPASALTEILSVYRRCEEEMSALHAQQAQEDDDADAALNYGRDQAQSTIPGGFDHPLGPDAGRVYNQSRREVGRLTTAATSSGSRERSNHRPTNSDDTPVGLFDLASGAAAALRRNAFPLRGGSNNASPAPQAAGRHAPPPAGERQGEEEDWGADWDEPAQPQTKHGSGGDEGEEEAWGWTGEDDQEETHPEHAERVRRRDMVASAVTGGLASGIGWVLGATPAGDERRRQP
ncbi:Sec39-domain-containing protein [Myriangium duriaei CBS 260.36]|uniref:Sec39-domain-containing protein n=1 Tax=Myriangium duriaei CBS 260.36 TaxID=1168546 RepID=A0A9P4J064_9PEZI|nr:Sec39-domain-containing protein [Myriangium duriaei CBS 260.36]